MAVLTTMQSTVEKTRELEETTSESSLDGADEEFVVKIDEYPIPLQLVYFLLARNAEANDPDMRSDFVSMEPFINYLIPDQIILTVW